MRAYSRVGGKVRIALPDDIETEHQPAPDRWSLIVDRSEYDELRQQILDGDPIRAELQRSLDDALSQIERLSDERDRWKATADSPFRQGLDCSPANVSALSDAVARLEKELAESRAARDSWKELAEANDVEISPVRRDLRAARRELDELRRRTEHLIAERDAAIAHAASAEAFRPIRMEVPAEFFTAWEDKELKAIIVSQAREITRLKGEAA